MKAPGDQVERRADRRQVQLDVRRLPRVLRQVLRPVRNPYVLRGVLDMIEGDLEAVAHGPTKDLHEAERHRLLEQMAAQVSYRQRVRRLTHEERRRCHLDWVRGSEREVLPWSLPPVSIPKIGTWHVAEDLGIGTAAYLEAMPDEVAVGLVQELHDRAAGDFAAIPEWGVGADTFDTVGLDEEGESTLRILVIGAGPKTFAHAVDAADDPSVRMRVVEVDPIESERETLCVDARHPDLGEILVEDHRFDVVVIHLPSPACSGAEQHRFIYYGNQIPGVDPGRLGRKKWRRWAMNTAQLLPVLLNPGGVAHLYLPNGIRGREDYEVDTTLTDGTKEALQGPLEIIRDVEVVPTQTVAQPFVAHQRCPWRLISAERKGGRHA